MSYCENTCEKYWCSSKFSRGQEFHNLQLCLRDARNICLLHWNFFAKQRDIRIISLLLQTIFPEILISGISVSCYLTTWIVFVPSCISYQKPLCNIVTFLSWIKHEHKQSSESTSVYAFFGSTPWYFTRTRFKKIQVRL